MAYNPATYARRNVVDASIGSNSGVATRYEKSAANYLALVVIASIAIWLEL